MTALLRDLDGLSVPVALLQATDIVTVLYRILKTCSDRHGKKQIKGILSKWKKQYSQSSRNNTMSLSRVCVAAQSPVSEATGQADSELGSSQTGSRPGGGGGGGGKRGAHAEDKPLAPMTDPPQQPPPEKTHPVSTPDDPCTPGPLPDIRAKCVQLLLTSLRSQGPPVWPQEEDEGLAGDIELHIHALHGASLLKYKACVRSRAANLRREPHLRRGLLDGSLLPRKLARMTAEEMAGPDLRRLRRDYTAQAVSEHQLPGPPEGTPTQKVQCRRCEASDCRVSQLSRGALFLPGWVKPGGPDHDGVTFVTCSVCGEQWYHSGWVCL